MNKIEQYPTYYELSEILSNISSRKFLDSLAQSKGFFFTCFNKDSLGKELAKYSYTYEELEKIRNEAYSISNSNIHSGFIIKDENSNEFNLLGYYNAIKSGNGQGLTDYIFSSLSKENEEELYHGSIQYTKRKIGRIEFIQNEKHEFEFSFFRKSDSEWQVETEGNRSDNLKVLKRILFDNTPKGIIQDEIIIDNLTPLRTIEFLDRLAKEGLNKNWLFTDVKSICVKNSNDDSEIVDNSEESESFSDLEKNKMDIAQAILQGKNLRENSFVKECENNHYFFSSMTYEFESNITSSVIQVKAEFKGRPKVFEISIGNTEERLLDDKRTPLILSSKELKNIKSEFWNNAFNIYKKI